MVKVVSTQGIHSRVVAATPELAGWANVADTPQDRADRRELVKAHKRRVQRAEARLAKQKAEEHAAIGTAGSLGENGQVERGGAKQPASPGGRRVPVRR